MVCLDEDSIQPDWLEFRDLWHPVKNYKKTYSAASKFKMKKSHCVSVQYEGEDDDDDEDDDEDEDEDDDDNEIRIYGPKCFFFYSDLINLRTQGPNCKRVVF